MNAVSGTRKAPLTFQVQGLSYDAPSGTRLIHDVSLEVRAGERMAVIGPNGAGKTTLLRLLSGRLRPRSGRVLLDGQDVARLGRGERARRLAIMVQNDRPDLRLRGKDYVGLGRIPHLGASALADERAISWAMETAGARHVAERRMGELSGGERQRLMLARALAQEPSALLLDEPTNNLDLRARADLIDIAAGLGITVIAVLHDLALAPDFADRIAVMSGGRLVHCAAPRDALSDAVVRSVFDMSVIRVAHPRDGRPLLMFEKPQEERQG